MVTGHPMMDISRFKDFHDAAGHVLEFLHDHFGFDLWMVTRVNSDDWIVLEAVDHGYGVESGQVFSWADSFCSRMVTGAGPRVAGRSSDVPAYVEAEIGRKLSIGSYIGIPLADRDGALFGTLCAIDPAEHPEIGEAELPMLELFGNLLSLLLVREMESMDTERQVDRLQLESMTDALTGLPNRRAWDDRLEAEERRARQLADPVFVSIIDLDELKEVNDTRGHAAGDRLLEQAAGALSRSVRDSDLAARIGGDEFGVIGIASRSISEVQISERLRTALAEAGVLASVGTAIRRADDDLAGTWKLADTRMYRQKRNESRAA